MEEFIFLALVVVAALFIVILHKSKTFLCVGCMDNFCLFRHIYNFCTHNTYYISALEVGYLSNQFQRSTLYSHFSLLLLRFVFIMNIINLWQS